MKAFIRYGSEGLITQGTLVKAKVKPIGTGWLEVPYTRCCETGDSLDTVLNGKYKAFIKYDGNGVVIGSSTIVRQTKPSMGDWEEVPYRECCGIDPISFETLQALIESAESEIVDTSTTGNDILPTNLWTSLADKNTFVVVIDAAKDILPDAGVFVIIDAYDDLSSAIDTYNQKKVYGTVPNRDTLNARIVVANSSKVTTSTNGDDVLPSNQWTTVAVLNTFESAITRAQGISNNSNVTQSTVNSETTRLNNAITAYNNAKQSGTTPNKSVLVSRIAAANSTKVGVSTNGNDVLPTSQWTTSAVLNTFNTAINSAELVNINNDVTKVQVDDAVTLLNNAINVYNTAKQNGTTPNKVPLVAAIDAANTTKVATSTNGNDILPTSQWVTSTVQSNLTTAITTATGVNTSSSVTQNQVTSAITSLNNAVITYNNAKQNGTTPDKATLSTRISVANTSKNGVVVSVDGRDVLPAVMWVSSSVQTTFNNAISAAQTTSNSNSVTYNQVNSAIATLNAAITTYNNAKAPGVTPDNTTLLDRLSFAETNTASTSLDGSDIPSTEMWVTSEQQDVYAGVISDVSSIATSNTSTQLDLDNALVTLNSAIDVYNSHKQQGSAE